MNDCLHIWSRNLQLINLKGCVSIRYAELDRRLVLQKRMAADNVGQKPLVRPESVR